MQKSLASSYIIEISPRGKQTEKINLQTSFSQENPSENSSPRDIIDVLETNLQIADTFDLKRERFGANTAADSGYEQTLSEESIGYVTSNTHASIRLDHIASSGDIYSDDKQIHLGKYIHFAPSTMAFLRLSMSPEICEIIASFSALSPRPTAFLNLYHPSFM